MTRKETYLILLLALAGGGFFAKLMYDMTAQVTSMAGSVGEMNGAVQAMARDVQRMATTMDALQTSMLRMDRTIHQGSEQLQRWNPMQMMEQAVPGSGRVGP
jgi:hypothetical protein